MFRELGIEITSYFTQKVKIGSGEVNAKNPISFPGDNISNRETVYSYLSF